MVLGWLGLGFGPKVLGGLQPTGLIYIRKLARRISIKTLRFTRTTSVAVWPGVSRELHAKTVRCEFCLQSVVSQSWVKTVCFLSFV